MEVVLSTQNNGLVFRNALDLVTPFTGNFDTCLNGLGTGVHRQDHVESKVARDELGKARENVIVECAGTQSHARSLIHEGSDQFGVTVALVHSGVGREEVKVFTTFGIPNCGTLSPGKDNRQGMVVVSGILLLRLDSLSRSSGMVVGERSVGGHDCAKMYGEAGSAYKDKEKWLEEIERTTKFKKRN